MDYRLWGTWAMLGEWNVGIHMDFGGHNKRHLLPLGVLLLAVAALPPLFLHHSNSPTARKARGRGHTRTRAASAHPVKPMHPSHAPR